MANWRYEEEQNGLSETWGKFVNGIEILFPYEVCDRLDELDELRAEVERLRIQVKNHVIQRSFETPLFEHHFGKRP